ncbi:MAG: TonB-dependent receptor [Blastocatellia bacterium]|nr:TonB-dependent receptor [Blastocatellia bacterium]
MLRIFCFFFLFGLSGLPLFPLISQPLRAQVGKCEATGTVTDQAGQPVPNASVVLTEIQTQRRCQSQANRAGIYVCTDLKPGRYTVTVEAQGWKRSAREGVQLRTGERIRLDVALEPGPLEEIVTVKADAPLLRSESGSVGQVINQQTITDLPLNGRTFISLAGLVPGVALPPGSAFPRINGGRPRTNEYLFDGISVLQPEPGQVAFFPVVDAIQEFKIESNSPSAEFGRFNGGVVNLTTRSGTDAFHGTVFEFLRNEALNARNLFANSTSRKPVFRRNQFGFVLGGPIRKGKIHFFADYQGTRQLLGRVLVSTVPTALQRQGIFTENIGSNPVSVFDPATTRAKNGGGFTRDPFPGNRIPLSRLDPVAVALLQRYPLPNSPGTANNFRRIGNESTNQNQFDVRLDYQLSAGAQIFGRYSCARDNSRPVTPLPDGSGQIASGVPGPTTTVGQSFASGYVQTFSPHMVNELRVGYTRRSIERKALLLSMPPSQSLNLPGIPANGAFQNELPTFVIDGFQQLGPPTNTDSIFRTDVTQVADTFSLLLGSHSLKFGGDLRWARLDVLQPPAPTGQFRFSSLFTDLPGVSGTGVSLASFLLGQVQTFSIDVQPKKLRPRAHLAELFLQDDWRVHNNLTVNAGLRYTLNFPSTEADNQGAIFNFQTQQLDYLGRNGFPETARSLEKLNFAPRLGLAYRIGEKTAVRAGYGMTWIEQSGITTPFTIPQFPFIQTVAERSLDNLRPAFVLAQGPTVTPLALTPDAGLGQGVFGVERNLGSGSVQQWNLTLQREIFSGLVVEVAYVGSKITHLGIPDTNLNQLTVEQLKLGSALLQRVPNPFFGQIPRASSLGDTTISRAQLLKPFPRFTTVSLYRNNVGNSNYHALLVKVEKRLSHGVAWLVSYTRSKLIDEASSVFDAAILTGPVTNAPVADSLNRKLERDVSSGDIPNNFVTSFTWEIPVGNGHRWNPRGWTGKLAQGWQFGVIATAQSGLPLAVTQATNQNAFAGFGIQRPLRLGKVDLPGNQQTVARFFNTAAFAPTPQFMLGTSSRNPVRGPNFRNLDMSLIKRTAITGQVQAEFRTEVFNLTNTPPLGAPNVVLGTPGFGSITSAGDPRVIQFGLKVSF